MGTARGFRSPTIPDAPGEVLGGASVSEQDLTGSKRFGNYLRRLREGRKLSLDAVVEMSTEFPEKLTKSHLSRMENGQALPSFPRLYALSRIYGVPTSSLAELFELDLELELSPPDFANLTDEEILEGCRKLVLAGRYSEALRLAQGAHDRAVEERKGASRVMINLRIVVLDCLVHTGHDLLGKEECEELLKYPGLSKEQRLSVLHYFILCCHAMGRMAVAMMGLQEAEKELGCPDVPPRLLADFEMDRAIVLDRMGNPELACEALHKAAGLFDSLPSPYEACRARVNLGQGLINAGRLDEAQGVLTAAIKQAETGGYDRLHALGLSHLALLAYRRGKLGEAETYALRSNALARPRDYLTLVFRNCFYLWKVALNRKDEASAKLNERALRAYAGRVEQSIPEAQEFRAHMAGGEA